VDAYAVQHPGKYEPRAAQSINVHLTSLYLILERNLSFDFVTKALSQLVDEKKHQFQWFSPPHSLGTMTVVDVVSAKTSEEHAFKVNAWAKSAWHAWQAHRKESEDRNRSIQKAVDPPNHKVHRLLDIFMAKNLQN